MTNNDNTDLKNNWFQFLRGFYDNDRDTRIFWTMRRRILWFHNDISFSIDNIRLLFKQPQHIDLSSIVDSVDTSSIYYYCTYIVYTITRTFGSVRNIQYEKKLKKIVLIWGQKFISNYIFYTTFYFILLMYSNKIGNWPIIRLINVIIKQ